MKNAKRMIALVIALVLAVSVFTACGENKDEKKNEAAITATAVKFSKDGKYTTTVKSDIVDLSKISVKNVEVSYTDYNEVVSDDTVNTAITKDKKTNEPETVKVKVESVKANSNGGYDITFTDKNAASNPTHYYFINFTKAKASVAADVDFPEITLTPDVKTVASNAKNVKLTLAIKGSKFESDISKDDIYLSNAFSEMKINSVSASDKNLTVQLNGSPVKNAAGAYQWGTINVNPSGIKDGYADVTAKVDIKLAGANFDAETLKYDNGNITAELKVNGVADVNKLTKDNVKLDGAKTISVKKVNDSTVKVTFSADQIKGVNDFANKFGDKEMTIDGYKTDAALSQAGFYPVFDYAEEDGDNLKLTLKLYADNGSFDKNIKADAISFADGFKDAKTVSVKVENDTLAELIISVPANGQTIETMKLKGTVTIAAGALVNAWGDKISKEDSYTRNYTSEALGKDLDLNAETLLEIQKYTRGCNTLFGKICYYGQIAGQVYSIGKSVLEAAGAIQSDQDKIMEQFSVINGKLDTIIDNQYKIMDMLDKVKEDLKEAENDRYRENLDDLKADIELQEELMEKGAMYMALEEAVKAGKLDKMPREEDFDKYKEYLPNVKGMNDEQLEEYNNKLIDYMIERSLNPKDPVFDDFKSSYENLKTELGHVADKLAKNDATNPIVRYDTLCSYKYNFDSQCYEFRSAQRTTAEALLSRAMMIVFAHEKVMTYHKETTFTKIQKRVEAAADWLDKSYDTVGHPTSQINATSQGITESKSISFVSDILLTCSDSYYDYSKLMNNLAKEGYSFTQNNTKGLAKTSPKGVYDIDVFDYPYYIYLGYKTTTDYSKAIKDFVILKDKTDPTIVIDGLTYYLASANGFKGNLDAGSSRAKRYLYYTRDSKPDNKAVIADGIDFSSTKKEGASDVNIYKSSSPRYFNYERKGLTYCPYSYVLGGSVCVSDSKNQPNCDNYGGAIKAGSSYRNWTDIEKNKFISRMQGNLTEEFKSAGIDIKHPLLLTFKWEKKSGYYNQWSTWTYWDYSGSYIKTNDKNPSSGNIGTSYIARTDGKPITKSKSFDVTFIELFG